ncbi:MAG: alcohol dehydrogenase catalytic domain-containing protein [Acidimicrobiales bacterium]|nr:alcohol dehydrogenase catalytic domain-containing protein [Acidimicrobiales bacterium]
MTNAVVAVQTGVRSLELRELPLPAVGDDDALLRVEACGICGTDVEQYRGELDGTIPLRYPLVPGHEPVGVIERIGDAAAARWGVDVGDRVAVESFLPCGSCPSCLTGSYEHCTGWDRMMAYGFIGIDRAPALWGGYATHLYLHPRAVLHRIPPGIAPDLATLFNPLGAGVRWAVQLPGTTLGDTVVVLGPGQRGLASVVAARMAGAGTIIVTGLGRDAHKLALAKDLGADHVIDVEAVPVVDAVRSLTGGRMADVVVDVTANATAPVADAVDLARPGGTIVLGGLKGVDVPAFPSDRVVLKGLHVIGARGVDYPAYRAAIDTIASGRFPLERLRTHTFGLDQAATAIEVLAGEHPGEAAVNVVIVPA